MCWSPSIRARRRVEAGEASRSGRRPCTRRRIHSEFPSSRRRPCATSRRRTSLAVWRRTSPLSPLTDFCCQSPFSRLQRCAVNLHASLLPRWGGAAPIQRAIMAGDAQTGVDFMRMDAGLDTGPVAMRQLVPIHPEDTTGDLMSRLAVVAAKLSVSALLSMGSGRLEFREQSTVGVCYARKIEKSEAEVDWAQDAEGVRNQIHGLSPAPGAYSKVL